MHWYPTMTLWLKRPRHIPYMRSPAQSDPIHRHLFSTSVLDFIYSPPPSTMHAIQLVPKNISAEWINILLSIVCIIIQLTHLRLDPCNLIVVLSSCCLVLLQGQNLSSKHRYQHKLFLYTHLDPTIKWMWFLPAWFVVTVTDTDWSGLGLYLDTPFTAQISKV